MAEVSERLLKHRQRPGQSSWKNLAGLFDGVEDEYKAAATHRLHGAEESRI